MKLPTSFTLPPTRNIDYDTEINYNTEIESIIKKNKIECNYLHGTRSSTLATMISAEIKEARQGCLLSRNYPDGRPRYIPKSGDVLLGADGALSTYNGRCISTCLYEQGEIAIHYSRIKPKNNPDNYPVIFGIKRNDDMNVIEIPVGDIYIGKTFTDYAIAEQVKSNDITMILVPENKAQLTRELCINTKLSHVPILEYSHLDNEN